MRKLVLNKVNQFFQTQTKSKVAPKNQKIKQSALVKCVLASSPTHLSSSITPGSEEKYRLILDFNGWGPKGRAIKVEGKVQSHPSPISFSATPKAI